MYQQGYSQLIALHLGDVFLGTPHLTKATMYQRKKQIRNLLQSASRFRKSVVEDALDELAILATLSAKYEQANEDTRVLSVFETEPTKLRSGPFSRKEIVSSIHLLQHVHAKLMTPGSLSTRSLLESVLPQKP